MDAREEISRSRNRRRHDKPKYEDYYVEFEGKKRSPSFLLKLHRKLMKIATSAICRCEQHIFPDIICVVDCDGG
ncbi:hypothetical protein Tcan_09565 [Toxocara canis]|uniref:Uncharacterized protein n=1 Tax=Toxocara canis TaxID=6265 RepID=A0A0B2VGC8_TOXCA|nr:hypothetical protein Tcan_09565 [Toxocara canis]